MTVAQSCIQVHIDFFVMIPYNYERRMKHFQDFITIYVHITKHIYKMTIQSIGGPMTYSEHSYSSAWNQCLIGVWVGRGRVSSPSPSKFFGGLMTYLEHSYLQSVNHEISV